MDEVLSMYMQESNVLLSRLGHSNKKRKIEPSRNVDLVPILNGVIQTKLDTPQGKRLRVLLDSGASTSIIAKELVKKLQIKQDSQTK